LSKRFFFLWVLGVVLFAALFGCACNRADEWEAATLPADVRADYGVFALRCSKCHSLARPLNSGIDNDEYWKLYVERMRRQPASGISIEDTGPILRFLHVYSVAVRKRKQEQDDAPAPAPERAPPLPPPDAGAPPVTGGS